jgi:hypothetical protein
MLAKHVGQIMINEEIIRNAIRGNFIFILSDYFAQYLIQGSCPLAVAWVLVCRCLHEDNIGNVYDVNNYIE